jgi:DNA repair exonuclease SbcCD nuclease subunit
VAGDLGHRPQWPNWLIEKLIFLINKYDVEIVAIPGQHDLPNHNLKQYRKSAIGVLSEAEAIKLIGTEHYFALKKYPFLFPFPYGHPIKKLSLEKSIKTPIAMSHQMVIENKPLWPEQEAPKGHQLLKKFPQYHLILTGDNHLPFTIEYEGRRLVNPGAMTRTVADQVGHEPRIYLWNAETNNIKAVYLPIEEDVISREHIDIKSERNKRIESYISRLKTQFEVGLDFKVNLQEHLSTTRTRKQVKERIWEAVEKE